LQILGGLERFFAISGLQILMLNTIRTFVLGKTMYLGVISLASGADSSDRKFICAAALVCYMLLFFK
jgi:hypothetical protein